MDPPTLAQRTAFLTSEQFLHHGFPNASFASSYGFISQLGNWTRFPTFDPSVRDIQIILQQPLDQPAPVNDVHIQNYTQTGYYPNVTDLCFTALSRNQNVKSLGRDFNRNGLFRICTLWPNLTHAIETGRIGTKPGELGADLLAFGFVSQSIEITRKMNNLIINYLGNTCHNIFCDTKSSAQVVADERLCDPGELYLNYTSTSNPNITLSARGILLCKNAICNSAQALYASDSDIGGIGVWISYVMQLGIHIIFALYIVYQFILNHYLLVKHRNTVIIQYYKRSLVVTPAVTAFRLACSQFQVAQGWFLLTLIIAATIEINGNLGSLIDYILLTALSNIGAILLSFTMVFCVYYETGSWFVMAITITAYVACSIFYRLAQGGIGPIRHLQPLPALNLCRSELSVFNDDLILQTTLETLVGRHTRKLFAGAWAISLVIMSSTLLKQLWPWIKETRLHKRLSIQSAKRINMESFWWVKRIVLSLIGAAGLAIVGYQFYLLVGFYRAVDRQRGVKNGGWRYGQVLASAVWLPMIFEFVWLYFTMKGPEDGVRRKESSLIVQDNTVLLEDRSSKGGTDP